MNMGLSQASCTCFGVTDNFSDQKPSHKQFVRERTIIAPSGEIAAEFNGLDDPLRSLLEMTGGSLSETGTSTATPLCTNTLIIHL